MNISYSDTTPFGGSQKDSPTSSTSKLIRILIVEDDEKETGVLVSCLRRYEQLHNQPFVISTERSAFNILDPFPNVDLVFMDIGLPGISGIEAAGIMRMNGIRTPIIFITSLAQYGASSYEVDALDFMVKPVSYGSFALRMDRALRIIRRTLGRSIFVKTKEGMRVMPVADVTAITVDGHSILYHLADGSTFESRGSLGKVAQDLAGTSFVRVTSGALVNMDYVRTVDTLNVKLASGEEYPISRPKRRDVLRAIASYYGGSKRS